MSFWQKVKVYFLVAWMWTKFYAEYVAKKVGHGLSIAFAAVVMAFHVAFVIWPPRAWRATKLFFWRLGMVIVIGSRYYANWSRFYQWVWERKYKDVPIQTYDSYRSLNDVIRTCTWTADGSKELGDAFSSAGYIQHIINEGGERHIGDCDEFAMYNSHAITKSLAEGVWKDEPIKRCYLMTVRWMHRETQKQSGHNVCLIELADGRFRYVDYWDPSPAYATKHEVALKVIEDYAGVDKADCIGWAIHDLDLSSLEIHWK